MSEPAVTPADHAFYQFMHGIPADVYSNWSVRDHMRRAFLAGYEAGRVSVPPAPRRERTDLDD